MSKNHKKVKGNALSVDNQSLDETVLIDLSQTHKSNAKESTNPEHERPLNKHGNLIETRMMREVISKTLSLHPCGVFVWCGPSAIGKTATAQYLVEKIGQNVAAREALAIRATHYQVGMIQSGPSEMKRSIKSLYDGALQCRLNAELYRRSTTEGLATTLTAKLQEEMIEMILIDDADFLSSTAIRGMMFVYKIAQSMGQTLSLVFIGTESLLKTIICTPPIFRHITDFSYFKEYSLEETLEILAAHHPYFSALDRDNAEHMDQVRFIHEKIGGYPGLLVSFLRRLNYYVKFHDGIVNGAFIRAVYAISQSEIEEMLANEIQLDRTRRRVRPSLLSTQRQTIKKSVKKNRD